MPARPVRPVPSNNIVVGSGTAEPVIVPCKVVTPGAAAPPAPDSGGTSRNEGLMLKVNPPIVIEVVVKVITPVLWFCAMKPVNVPTKLPLPAVGAV